MNFAIGTSSLATAFLGGSALSSSGTYALFALAVPVVAIGAQQVLRMTRTGRSSDTFGAYREARRMASGGTARG